MARVARELRQPSQDWLVGVHGALLALLEGPLDEAERLGDARARARRARAELERRRHLPAAALRAAPRAGPARRGRGARPPLGRRVPDVPDLALRAGARAGGAGRARRGAATRSTTLARDRFAALPFDEEWLVSMGLLADAAVARRDVGRARAPRAARPLRRPGRRQLPGDEPAPSPGTSALLAAAIGRGEDAERHFEEALELNASIGAPRWYARTEREAARLLDPD